MSTEPVRPRHRSDSGYARGEETRQRLLEVAIQCFGEGGYKGASTRDIARLAGVNAPALQYYFDSKEGLYRACMAYLGETAEAHFAPVLEQAEAVLEQVHADREAVFGAFAALLDTLADYLLHKDAEHRRRFIAQDEAGHGVTREPLDRPGRYRMKRVSAALVGRLCGLPPDDPLTLLRMMTLQGQLLVFHVIPRTAMQSLRWEPGDPKGLALLKKTIREQTRAVVEGWWAASPGTSSG